MALETYRAKRDFSRTAEPAGADRRGSGDAFVVQKHAARRLHYDFRLEIGDVLASWAVTKGPSLVPGEKRLAVHVEDHPLDYADFEGTIAKGSYGAGEVIVWDRGRWQPEGDPAAGLRKGRLDFTPRGREAQGPLAPGAHGAEGRREARELAADQGQGRRGARTRRSRHPRRGAGVGDLRPDDRGGGRRAQGRPAAEGGARRDAMPSRASSRRRWRR